MGLGSSREQASAGDRRDAGGSGQEGDAAVAADVSDGASSMPTQASILRGDLPEGRMPGLLPFTTVAYEEPLADRLYDRAMIHGWLSCVDRLSSVRRERWCAVHDNKLYEFEPQVFCHGCSSTSIYVSWAGCVTMYSRSRCFWERWCSRRPTISRAACATRRVRTVTEAHTRTHAQWPAHLHAHAQVLTCAHRRQWGHLHLANRRALQHRWRADSGA